MAREDRMKLRQAVVLALVILGVLGYAGWVPTASAADIEAKLDSDASTSAFSLKNLSSAEKVRMDAVGAITAAGSLTLNGTNTGIAITGITNEPAVPSAGILRIYSKSVAGRMMPKWVGPAGIDTPVQSFIAKDKIALFTPAGNSTTITAIGAAALTATGTATASNVAVTNRHYWMKRLDYLVTSASTTAVAGFRGGVAQYGIGGSAGDGGFHFICRFGPATGVATATNRCFVGMGASTAAPTDVQPSSIVNILGFGWDAADTNIQWMNNDGSGTATKTDLGANFPVPTADRTKVYEAAIFVAPNGSTIYYEFTDLATGNVATGSVTTDIPTNTTLLAPRGWMSVGGTSSVIGIALMSLYIETDY